MELLRKTNIFFKSILQLGITSVAYYLLYKIKLHIGIYKFEETKRRSGAQAVKSIQHLFGFPSPDQLLRTIEAEGKKNLLEEAEEIVHGKVRVFSGKPVELELNFHQPLDHWTVYENHSEILGKLIAPIQDIKFIWEPARFGWAYKLGYAFHLTQDARFAESFWRLFEEFETGNPAYLGPHWMNGQEVAIRLLALIWCAQIFASTQNSPQSRKEVLYHSIAAHATRIPWTLSYARAQNNNHLVVEAAALYSAGIALQQSDWKKTGWRWLNWCFQNQISGYGEYIQQSTNYHRLMLQAALWVNAILPSERKRWPTTTEQALARASHWLFSVLDPVTGQVPNLGANDGGLILPLSVCSDNNFRPTVQAAARAFLRTQLPSGIWDDLPMWLGLEAVEKTHQSDHYLMDNLHGKDSWAYLRASRFKSRLVHMDQLHLDLWWRGLNITKDAGTYRYRADAPWDNAMVTTRVHNTVTVDGRDQMTHGGRFLTLDWFPAYSKSIIDTNEKILQKSMAYHHGYRGVQHERFVTVFIDGHWLVEDQLRSQTQHTYRLHWLIPDWEWETSTRGERIELRIKSPHGWITLGLDSDPSAHELPSMVTITRAGEQIYGQNSVSPIDGWISDFYGEKSPALSIAVTVKAVQNFQFRSEFTFSN